MFLLLMQTSTKDMASKEEREWTSRRRGYP
jgi:hypothetical protein